jgi:hypothetical protein
MYLVLDPRTLARELALSGTGLVALIVMVNPGIVDEIVFRGVLQRAVVAVLGPSAGMLYLALLYAPVLPAGLVAGTSLLGMLLTFGLGMLLSFVTLRTGSILSAAVAHASLALGLFVIGPQMVPGGLGLSEGTPTVPVTADARTPTTKPVVVVSPATTIPPPQIGKPTQDAVPPQPAQPTSPGPTPQAPPAAGQTATPVTLAPPIAPPQTSPASGPTQPSAGGGGQIVVVRGTGGSGARLRAQPGNAGQIITVVPEYTPLVVIGPDRTADGLVWRNVRAPSGGDGWIAANFVTTGQ